VFRAEKRNTPNTAEHIDYQFLTDGGVTALHFVMASPHLIDNAIGSSIRSLYAYFSQIKMEARPGGGDASISII